MTTMYPTLPIVRINPDAPLPAYAHAGDAGIDLCAMKTVKLLPHEIVKVGSGIATAIPEGFYGALVPRSGMSTKRGITLINTPGTIDSTYRGEIIMALYNASTNTQVIEKGERVCQLIITPYASATIVEVASLDETERGDGGFGSTGVRGRL